MTLKLDEMTTEERDVLMKSILVEALDKFRENGATAYEMMTAIDAYINVRLGETLRQVNESLEIAMGLKKTEDDDGDPRRTFQ